MDRDSSEALRRLEVDGKVAAPRAGEKAEAPSKIKWTEANSTKIEAHPRFIEDIQLQYETIARVLDVFKADVLDPLGNIDLPFASELFRLAYGSSGAASRAFKTRFIMTC